MTVDSVARRRSLLGLLLALALAGLMARLVVLHFSAGTNDIFTWNQFAKSVSEQGVVWLYANNNTFNHPPLMGYLGNLALWLSDHLRVRFAVVFKVAPILAELMSAWILWDLWRRRRGPLFAALVAAAFAWNLDTILVAAHHGNTDCIFAALCLLSAYLVEEHQLHFAGGLALAAAINVKLIPVLLVGPMLARYRRLPDAARFAGGLSLGVIPFIPVLILAGRAFYSNAIAYNSNIDNWGFIFFFRESLHNGNLHSMAESELAFYRSFGRQLVLMLMGALTLIAWATARFNRYQLGAMTLATFLFFTPGFGVQYTACVVPLLFADRPAIAAGYSLLAGLFIGFVYWCFWNRQFPATTLFARSIPSPGTLFGLLAWWTLGCYLTTNAWSACRTNGGAPGQPS